MAGENNFIWSKATNLQRFLYKQSYEKAESDKRIREALLNASLLAKYEVNKSRQMFKDNIYAGEDAPDKAQTGRFLLDQMMEESKVAAAALAVLDKFDQATKKKQKILDDLLKG
jgi:hypothetical protein